jgi:RNA polymerase sigma-70 factor (ECF subfamily)
VVAEESIDWQAWIERHGPAALLYAKQITRTHADAEDAVHDGFIRFWSARGSAQSMPALFFTCVRSAALDLRRGRERRRVRERDALPALLSLTGPGDAAELREQVEHALGQLPEPQREVVVLKIWCDLSLAEIAGILRESPNTVASRYRYAMEKLESLLMPEVENGTRE